MHRSILAAVAFGMAVGSPAWAQSPDPAPKPAARADSCFYINQLEGQHALNDHAVVFRVNVSDYYELTFAHRCAELTYPDPKLILTPFGGNALVCRAIDLDVKVSEQGPGQIPVSCITDTLRKLTPAEVAAIPKKNLP